MVISGINGSAAPLAAHPIATNQPKIPKLIFRLNTPSR